MKKILFFLSLLFCIGLSAQTTTGPMQVNTVNTASTASTPDFVVRGTSTDKTFRRISWTDVFTAFSTSLPPGLALGEISSTAYRGDRGKTAYDHSQITGSNPHNTNIAQILVSGADAGNNTLSFISGIYKGQIQSNRAYFEDEQTSLGVTYNSIYSAQSISFGVLGEASRTSIRPSEYGTEIQLLLPSFSGTLALLSDIPSAPTTPDLDTILTQGNISNTAVIIGNSQVAPNTLYTSGEDGTASLSDNGMIRSQSTTGEYVDLKGKDGIDINTSGSWPAYIKSDNLTLGTPTLQIPDKLTGEYTIATTDTAVPYTNASQTLDLNGQSITNTAEVQTGQLKMRNAGEPTYYTYVVSPVGMVANNFITYPKTDGVLVNSVSINGDTPMQSDENGNINLIIAGGGGEESQISVYKLNGDIEHFDAASDTNSARGVALQAAKTAAVSGDLIVVNPGVYDTYDLAKNGISYYFNKGAEVTYTGGVSNAYTFTDGGVEMKLSVLGYGKFTTTDDFIYINNADTNFNIECERLEAGARGIANYAGIVTLKGNYLFSQDGLIDSINNISETATTIVYAEKMESEGYCVEHDGGIIKVYAKIISALGVVPAVATSTGIGSVYIESEYISAVADVAVGLGSTDSDVTIKGATIVGFGTDYYSTGSGKLYFDGCYNFAGGQYITGDGTAIYKDRQVVVETAGNQTIGGVKTFSSTIVGNISGNASTVTTNANLIGTTVSVGNTTTFGSFASSALSTALSDESGTGVVVFNNSPTLITPNLGTPSALNLTNATSLPSSSITGLASGMPTFLTIPSSANFLATLTDETGTGAAVFGTSPAISGLMHSGSLSMSNGSAIVNNTSSTFFGLTVGTTSASASITRNTANAIAALQFVNANSSSTGDIHNSSSNIGGVTAIRAGVRKDGRTYGASGTASDDFITKSQAPISNAFSGVGTATTTFTVTIGTTMPNTTYEVNATPTNLLSAAVFYINNKTTTAFDVVYLTGLTGTVTFDWSVFP